MTEEHLSALFSAAEAKKDAQGWMQPPEGRNFTLYLASNGASMTVGKVEAIQVSGKLIRARTVRGDEYVLALEDVFAGAIDAPPESGRKAGFV